MSSTRIVVRIFLVLVIVGLCYIGWWTVKRQSPDYYWNRAQAAHAAGDWQRAEIEVNNLLKMHPEHGEARRLRALVMLDKAKADGKPDTFATNGPALQELMEAARLLPSDVELHRQLVNVHLDAGRLADAALVAGPVLEADPSDPAALFSTAAQALKKKDYVVADKRLQMLAKSHAGFEYRFLELQWQWQRAEKNAAGQAETQQLFAETLKQTAASSLKELPLFERVALLQMIVVSVDQASDQAAAAANTLAGMRAAEALAEGKVSARANLSPRAEAAEFAGALLVLFDKKHPAAQAGSSTAVAVGPQAPQVEPARAEMVKLAEQLRRSAIDAGVGTPAIHHQSALAAFQRGDEAAGMKTLQDGIAVAEKRPGKEAGDLLGLHQLAAQRLMISRKFDDADKHLAVLLADKKYAGWGHLLAGSIAVDEGRHERALDHFLKAQKSLGNTLLVRIALSNTYLSLKNWREALPHLAAMHVDFAKLSPEQRAWAERFVGSGDHVHWGELRARLALDEWKQAQTHLEALRGTALEPNACLLAVTYLLSTQQTGQAMALLADSRRQFPRDSGLLRMEVTLLEKAGKRDDAIKLMDQYALAAPDDLAGQMLYCRWLQQIGKVEDSIARLTTLETRPGLNDQDKLAIAVSKAQGLLLMGDADGALAVVEHLPADAQSAAAANLIEAAAAAKDQDWQGASKALNEAGAANPRSGAVGLLRGEMAAAQGDYEAAIAALSGSMDVTVLRDRARNAMLRSIMLLARQKSPAAAYARVEELLKVHPNDAMLIMAKADLDFQQGRIDAGMRGLDRIDQLQPTSPTAAFLKGTALARQDRSAEAMNEIERALKLDPAHAPSLLLAAETSLKMQRYRQALDYAVEAFEHHDNLWGAKLIQAEALNQLERRDEAIEVLKDLVKQLPRSVPAALALGAAHVRYNQPDEAIAVYRAAQREMPEEFSLVSAEIEVLLKTDRVPEANARVAALAEADLTADQALLLAQAFGAGNQTAEARTWAEKALAIGEDRHKIVAHMFLGNLALTAGMADKNTEYLEQARDQFAAVIAVEPANFIAGNNLAWLLATQFNQPERAIEVAEKVRGNATVEQMPSEFVDTLAEVYRHASRYTDAAQLLQPALAARPQQPQLHFQMGMVLLAEKRPADARRALETALQLGLTGQQADDARRELAALEAAQ